MTDYLLRVNSSGEVLDGEGKPTGNVVVPSVATKGMLSACTSAFTAKELYAVMLSAARPDIAALAVRVPHRRPDDTFSPDAIAPTCCDYAWNACLDALGIKP